jgi:hypothetical protein
MLSATKIIKHRIVGLLLNKESERMSDEVIPTSFKTLLLLQKFPTRTEIWRKFLIGVDSLPTKVWSKSFRLRSRDVIFWTENFILP